MNTAGVTPDTSFNCEGCTSERMTGLSSRSRRAAPCRACGSAPSTSILMKVIGRRNGYSSSAITGPDAPHAREESRHSGRR